MPRKCVGCESTGLGDQTYHTCRSNSWTCRALVDRLVLSLRHARLQGRKAGYVGDVPQPSALVCRSRAERQCLSWVFVTATFNPLLSPTSPDGKVDPAQHCFHVRCRAVKIAVPDSCVVDTKVAGGVRLEAVHKISASDGWGSSLLGAARTQSSLLSRSALHRLTDVQSKKIPMDVRARSPRQNPALPASELGCKLEQELPLQVIAVRLFVA